MTVMQLLWIDVMTILNLVQGMSLICWTHFDDDDYDGYNGLLILISQQGAKWVRWRPFLLLVRPGWGVQPLHRLSTGWSGSQTWRWGACRLNCSFCWLMMMMTIMMAMVTMTMIMVIMTMVMMTYFQRTLQPCSYLTDSQCLTEMVSAVISQNT